MRVVETSDLSKTHEIVILILTNRAGETLIGRCHGNRLEAVEHSLNIRDDFANVVIGNKATEVPSDSLWSVDKNQRKNGVIPLGFDAQVVVAKISEAGVIERRYDKTSKWAESGENVPRTSRIFAPAKTRAKLTDRLEKIDVVTSYEVLSETNNRVLETRL